MSHESDGDAEVILAFRQPPGHSDGDQQWVRTVRLGPVELVITLRVEVRQPEPPPDRAS